MFLATDGGNLSSSLSSIYRWTITEEVTVKETEAQNIRAFWLSVRHWLESCAAYEVDKTVGYEVSERMQRADVHISISDGVVNLVAIIYSKNRSENNYYDKTTLKATTDMAQLPTEVQTALTKQSVLIKSFEYGVDVTPFIISCIERYGERIDFINPIEIVPVYYDDEKEFEIKFPKLGIIARGRTRTEVLDNFKDDFIWLWDEYVEEKEELLTEDAIELKQKLIAMVNKK